ncbi:hypothetical protein [Thauera sinica]|uniref:Uncharacterized protein n=1 Tax=Thauera sinica TaxID=2665146 RepID=A0ABW1AY59_9RHOO|nr:hypothetical protein [Thauera sp. K11]ATE60142.1 hypothetical protein CCZ27_09445 [Thauera sp. K11]
MDTTIIPIRLKHRQCIPAPGPAPVHVLTDRTVDRLQALNTVARQLRSWNIDVIREDIAGAWPAIGHPTITIRRSLDRSIAPLLDAVGRVTWIRTSDGVTGLAVLYGVRITWSEPR